MRRALWFLLFGVHAVLILLACTRFTLVTFFLDGAWRCQYFGLSYASGWGYRYVSDYSTWQTLVYVAGYALGFPVFAYALRRGWEWIGWVGILICGLGCASFLIEASHLISDHHTSLIASFPCVLAVLWIAWLVMAFRSRRAAPLPPVDAPMAPAEADL